MIIGNAIDNQTYPHHITAFTISGENPHSGMDDIDMEPGAVHNSISSKP